MTPKWLSDGLWHWVYHLNHQCRPTSEGATVCNIHGARDSQTHPLCQSGEVPSPRIGWADGTLNVPRDLTVAWIICILLKCLQAWVNSWRAFLSDASEVALYSVKMSEWHCGQNMFWNVLNLQFLDWIHRLNSFTSCIECESMPSGLLLLLLLNMSPLSQRNDMITSHWFCTGLFPANRLPTSSIYVHISSFIYIHTLYTL